MSVSILPFVKPCSSLEPPLSAVYLYRKIRAAHVNVIYNELKKNPSSKPVPSLLLVLPDQVVDGTPIKTLDDVAQHVQQLK